MTQAPFVSPRCGTERSRQSSLLALLLLGIAHLARAYGVMAMDQTKEG